MSVTHIGPAQAQSAGVNLAVLLARLSADEAKIAALQQKTAPISVSGTDFSLTDVNVHIVSGSGSTDDNGTLTGLGNLIIGYNNSGKGSGSHNLIVGDSNFYTSYGGLVAGVGNTISGPYGSVSGGSNNTASGNYSSVSGGYSNVAGGEAASVSGGYINVASGRYAAVSGGAGNQAKADHASVSGGQFNTAADNGASVSGGENNISTGFATSISGGNGLTLNTNDAWAGGSYHTP